MGLAGLAFAVVACGEEAVPVAESGGAEPVAETTIADDRTAPLEPWPTTPSGDDPPDWTVEIVDRLPHDTEAFTQGLEVHDGIGYESTGIEGASSIRTFDPMTGLVREERALDDDLFGEGLTVVGDTAVQLTWRDEIALRWDTATLEPLEPVGYSGEGWGLCATAEALVMTDGTADVQHRSFDDFAIADTVTVRHRGRPVSFLNELECIDGLVMANIWSSSEIVVFDPSDGAVVATIDAGALTEEMAEVMAADPRLVLNGIADVGDGTLLLTGKQWPTTYRVRLIST